MTATLPEASTLPSTTFASRFIWHDLMSTSLDPSLAFYAELLGWKSEPIDMGEMGHYHMLHADGQPFGGGMVLDPAHGLHSHWISYISCPDVDATVARAQELGATIGVPPTDIPDVGRFAVVIDPQGVPFSPLTLLPGAHGSPEGTAETLVPVGCPIWTELITSDPDAATAFYCDLFGWTPEQMPMQHGGTYTLLGRGPGLSHAGGLMRNPDDTPSAWIVYFHVADAAGTAARVADLGGSIVAPVFTVPGVGEIAWLQDPAGAFFAILQPSWTSA